MLSTFFYLLRKVIGELSSGQDCDDDVSNERQRVINGDANSECLRLVNLTKVIIIEPHHVPLFEQHSTVQ